MVDPQGRKATTNGAKFEDVIEKSICDILGIETSKWTEAEFASSKGVDMLWKNVPYESIYGTKCRSEFLLAYNNREIRIECKSQESSGSVDEKLPYLVQNFTEKVKEEETIIIHHGDGFRAGAINWLREACEGTKCKVFTDAQFIFYMVKLKNANSTKTV
tara:strand:+ start:1243 stop:1722 length:480 start_codon:yes stop_codon:yes gene_type:complete